MKAPRRLLDDPTAPAGLRGELSRLAAKQVSYDAAAGLDALKSRLAGSAEASAGQAALNTGAAGSLAGGLPIALKLVLLAALGGGLAGAANWLGSSTSHSPAQPVPAARAAPEARPTGAAEQPEASSVPPTRANELEQPSVRVQASERDAASASRREIAQLVRIRALLERDPAAAHLAIQAAQREFPSGMLREEREGLDAIALARSGDERRARAQAERFVRRYPQSALRPRLEQLLAGPKP